jgi:hypothetical protein
VPAGGKLAPPPLGAILSSARSDLGDDHAGIVSLKRRRSDLLRLARHPNSSHRLAPALNRLTKPVAGYGPALIRYWKRGRRSLHMLIPGSWLDQPFVPVPLPLPREPDRLAVYLQLADPDRPQPAYPPWEQAPVVRWRKTQHERRAAWPRDLCTVHKLKPTKTATIRSSETE